MKFLTIVAVTILTSLATPQTSSLQTQGATRALADSAMQLIVKDDIAGLFALLRPHLRMPEAEYGDLRNKTIEQRRMLAPRFGKTVGVGFVREQRLSDFAVKYVFVEKRAMHVLRWQFIFYKPTGSWQLDAFVWDDNFDAMFD